ncbi:MAG: LuxR C-terminal-related transcriptional regulator [Roseiflexaceae bacterium]
MPDQLLATKFFVPGAAQALITRPRLTALLDDSLRRKLTLVAAPAGFGKTTLVAEWLHQNDERRTMNDEESNHRSSFIAHRFRVAWLSLDEADNDPLRFWAYVLTALDTCHPGIAALLPHIQTHNTPLEPVLTALINILIDTPEPLLLVFDDFHVITEPAIHMSLAFLLEHLPPQVHLILLARTDPPLALSRLRARGQVLELRTDQLRCTPEEAESFLNHMMHIALPPDVLQEAIAHTEGWLAGLQLLGLWLQTKADLSDVVDQLIGSHPYILDYLMEEVLQQQPEQVQTFLLHTAFLGCMCASLCDAVLGTMNDECGTMNVSAHSADSSFISHRSSFGMLEYLERSNLFVVPLDAQRGWYRYHPLFAEALRYRLEQTQPDQVLTLHWRASCWYAEHGRINDAIQHALVARDWQWAADLIEQYRCNAALAKQGSDLVALRQWLGRLPEDVVRARPRLCLVYAQTLLFSTPPATIDPWLAAAETTLRAALAAQMNEDEREAGARDEQANLLGELVAGRALLAGLQGDGRAALTLCQQALGQLSAQNLAGRADVAYVQSMAYAAVGQAEAAAQRAQEASELAWAAGDVSGAIFSTAIISMSFLARQMQVQGQLQDAWQVLRQAVQLGETPDGLRCASVCLAYTIQADLLREWNRLDEAHALVLRAIQLTERLGAVVLQGVAYVVLARIEQARGNRDAAHLAVQSAEQIGSHLPPSQLLAYRVRDMVQLWLASGEHGRAAYWAEQLAQAHGQTFASFDEQAQIALVRVTLAQGKPSEALERLAPLIQGARAAARWGDMNELLVLQARAYQTHHDQGQALATLAEAVRRAEPEGYIRIFADEGPPMAALLAQLRDQERRRGPTPYLDMLLAAFPDCRLQIADCRLPAKQSAIYNLQSALVEPLSARELEVLHLMARGASNQEIAEKLVLALNTVKRHVSNIIAKLGAANRTQAVAQARPLGLLADEPSVGSRLLAVAV